MKFYLLAILGIIAFILATIDYTPKLQAKPSFADTVDIYYSNLK